MVSTRWTVVSTALLFVGLHVLLLPTGCAQTPVPVPEAAPDPSPLPPAEEPTPGMLPRLELEGQQGWLGVALVSTSKDEARALGYAQPLIEVDIVFAGSPAETSGFKPGDVIVALDDEAVYKIEVLVERVKAIAPGSRVTFTRIRDGKEETIPLLLSLRPDAIELVLDHFTDRPAPELNAVWASDGEPVRLSDFRGKVVALDFWATWCGPCLRSQETLAKLHAKFGNEHFAVIGLSDEEPEVVRAHLSESPSPYPIALDTDRATSRTYMVTALPSLYLIDGKGVVRKVFVGSDQLEHVESVVEGLLSPAP